MSEQSKRNTINCQGNVTCSINLDLACEIYTVSSGTLSAAITFDFNASLERDLSNGVINTRDQYYF